MVKVDTNGQPTVVESYEYDAYGQPTILGQSNIANPYMFHGRRQDPETGLYYNRLRYYCSRTGRFTRIDPGGNWADPATIGNGYNFGDAAPTFGVDPDGQFFFTALAIVVSVYKAYDAVDTAVSVVKEVVAVATGEKSISEAAVGAAKAVVKGAVIGAGIGAGIKAVVHVARKVKKIVRGTPMIGTPPPAKYRIPSPEKAPTPAPRGPTTATPPGPKTPPPAAASSVKKPPSTRAKTGDGKQGNKGPDGDNKPCPSCPTDCFLLGTMVATPDGMRPIESLEVGDSVLSRNDKTGEVAFKKIEHVHRYHTNRVCRLRITRAHRAPTRQRGRSEPHRVGKGSASADDDSSESTGSGDPEDPESATELPVQELLCTTGHNFYSVTRSDWIAAVYLRPGEVLLDASGRIQRVVSISWEDAHAPVRDFEVADWHTYFVSQPGASTPVWTHNGGQGKPCTSNPDSGNAARASQFRDGDGSLRDPNGRYAPDGGRKRTSDGTHGNTAGDQPATLYQRYDADGDFLKWGVSQDPSRRYTSNELNGGYLVRDQTGPRKEMLRIERDRVETDPGPLN